MSIRRWSHTPALNCSPRTSIDPSFHASIDSVLKDLKSCSRRLQAVFSGFHDELQVLQRLYYKGKNQHRPALFWKRAAEMKRYGERLDYIGLPGVFELLRCSFFGATSIENSKNMRGSWTHVPNSTYVAFVMKRLAACLTLVDEIHERLVQIYRSFKLAMQSGAFIQLILTLAAISARMDALLPEFQDALRIGWNIGRRFLQVVDPEQAQRMRSMPKLAEHKDVPVGLPAIVEADPRSPLNEVSLDDDIGSSVARNIHTVPPHHEAVDIAVGPALSVVDDDAIVVSGEVLEHMITVDESDALLDSRNQEGTTQMVVKRVGMTSKRSRKAEEVKGDQPKKKAKKKRNEIDDIFDS